ncbi:MULTISPECIES: ABC transporter ATP-binding protein [unclassified Neptuniibacter]|jgi:ABC-type nitrate/sulfonate/bicarbonate transport system ATPase subunit|uniref:ABC transporter ATP-binding protein n=1 Tax=unclassified Neptuniibacter TaxID=2630693 RepID=UPI0026E416FE|nr:MULTISPECIES: ABC transporter ATP-binding protein [unclassified Neptuniibacter]MDO6514471.1 ABC transporter ATP-binding protein [Neptuniibacter sp. 2_MG-2023]MDO6594804.1 ABC transporter ATP-binding protein [Neptuniibacter sp. 1_MG-2023]
MSNNQIAQKSSSKGILIQNVSKMFYNAEGEGIEALKPVNLDIKAGEFVAVIGPSGCGKSTLLNIIAGFESATAGSVWVDGEKITQPSIDRGMVFQQYALFPWLSVSENVEFGLKQMQVPAEERKKIVHSFLELVGLQEFANASIMALSGGMKQRVALARVFCTNPSIILMDEPFGALDALTRSMLQDELLAIWKEYEKTVVLITHSVQEALVLANRIVVITNRPGKIKLDIEIKLPYPRDKKSLEFRELEAQILSQLTDEIAKNYGAKPKSLTAD